MISVDASEIQWWHLALCQGMNDPVPGAEPHQHDDYFFEVYEDDPEVAKVMDDICKSCPVRLMCLRDGIENKETGLWGGIYLNNGRPDLNRNAHKTPEDWEEIRELLSA